MNAPDTVPRPDRRSGLIWAVLVVTLAVVIVAGVRSYLSPGRSGRGTGFPPGGGSPSGTRASGPAGESWKPREPGTSEAAGVGAHAGGSANADARGGANPDAREGADQAGAAAGAAAQALPVGEEAPAFSLTERRGGKLTRADLEGKVWIANFIFTTCGSVCPDLTRKMAAVRERLKAEGAVDVLSVSFSVDPVNDTPAVLTGYAKKFHAETPSWLFLTGDPKEMLRVVNKGFRVLMSDPAEGMPAHTDRFILVDAAGRQRTTHQGSEPNVVDTLVREALALRKEKNG
jgi:protein SCO1/2